MSSFSKIEHKYCYTKDQKYALQFCLPHIETRVHPFTHSLTTWWSSCVMSDTTGRGRGEGGVGNGSAARVMAAL